MSENKNFEICGIELTMFESVIKIITIYRSPSSNFDIFIDRLDKVLNMSCINGNCKIIICSNLNIDYSSNCKQRNEFHFLNICNDFNQPQSSVVKASQMNMDDLDINRIKKMIEKDSFPENFEIDDEQKYEKIDVPDFKDGRTGRFIHDFNTNITGIIDVTGQRCFVMPLNRGNVLPPKSLFDLIHKMWEGYYKVDTEVVRKTMKVVIPPISDTKSIGLYIASECDGLPIYKLEKYEGGVVKRSADLHPEAKFAEFAGKGITEFDIVNLDEVVAYEKNLNNN